MYNKMSSFDSENGGDLSQSLCDHENYYENSGNYYTHLYPADSQNSGGNHVLQIEEEGYWGSPTSSESHDNNNDYSPHHQIPQTSLDTQSSYYYTPPYCQSTTNSVYEKTSYEVYYTTTPPNGPVNHVTSNGITDVQGHPVVRVIKRRNTANKKERRRTQSINSAYSCLRERIPNVPSDTKLSKIKTLRLAISYISHLLDVVNGRQDPSSDFRAELVPSSRKLNAERRAQLKNMQQNLHNNNNNNNIINPLEAKKIKGRTGWPQHVWALETKTSIK